MNVQMISPLQRQLGKILNDDFDRLRDKSSAEPLVPFSYYFQRSRRIVFNVSLTTLDQHICILLFRAHNRD